MKPIALSFQNFGSYRAMQQIDFRQLYDAGLFLITGSTGGGKTTILDAMCCALYGCSSGNSQEELSMLRSRHAGEREETMVSFTFDMHGQRYTFTRRLTKKRVNFEESYSLTVLKDGVEHALKAHLTKTIMKEQAEKIVGLTYQQFSQIMILPQGKFGEFLIQIGDSVPAVPASKLEADAGRDERGTGSTEGKTGSGQGEAGRYPGIGKGVLHGGAAGCI